MSQVVKRADCCHHGLFNYCYLHFRAIALTLDSIRESITLYFHNTYLHTKNIIMQVTNRGTNRILTVLQHPEQPAGSDPSTHTRPGGRHSPISQIFVSDLAKEIFIHCKSMTMRNNMQLSYYHKFFNSVSTFRNRQTYKYFTQISYFNIIFI